MYFASKVLMFVHPLFYLMPNLIYALPVVNGIGHYTAGAVSDSLEPELNFKLNKIRALLSRLANKISSLDAATRVDILKQFFEGQNLIFSEEKSPQEDFQIAIAAIVEAAFHLDEHDQCADDNKEACEFSVTYSKLQTELENLLWFIDFTKKNGFSHNDGEDEEVQARVEPLPVFQKLEKRIQKLKPDVCMRLLNMYQIQSNPQNSKEAFELIMAAILEMWDGESLDELNDLVKNAYDGIDFSKC